MTEPPVRIHLAGRVFLEADGRLLRGEAFPGQQGRLVFAYLVLERGRPVAREELMELLWPRGVPDAAESALNAVVSKLRSVLARGLPPGLCALSGGRGTYDLVLPRHAWVDLEAAAHSVHEAEAAMRAGRARDAYGSSAVAHHIARRPFFPGHGSAWVETRRERLRAVLLRALEVRGAVYLWNGEPALALQCGRDMIAQEPFRESGHRLVMRACAAMGNRAEALQAFARCQALIADELGATPSAETMALFEQLRVA